MDNTNRDLLTSVITKNLESVISATEWSDDEKIAFKQAMEAIDRQNRISDADDAYRERTDKLELENKKLEIEKQKMEMEKLYKSKDEELNSQRIELEKQKIEIEKQRMEVERLNRIREDDFRRQESRKAWIYRGIEIVAIYAFAPMLESTIKNKFAKICMLWETENTFTSTPGRSVKDFFRFKK